MRRREFVSWTGAGLASLAPGSAWLGAWSRAPWLLVPMDDAQTDHLKAYGLTYRALKRGVKAEWLLNYRSGAFLLPGDAGTARDAALAGVSVEPLEDSQLVQIRGGLRDGNMDAVPLEKPPKVAVYAPPNAPPWDDAVTMALNYAGIEFEKVWDAEVMGQKLKTYDWLHLHHEDFTGQYSKFFLNYAGSAWLVEMVERNRAMARTLGFPSVPAEKGAVAAAISNFVDQGGFLFAMCTATETLDLALAADGVDIAASYADGDPMDPNATNRLKWDKSFAFHNAQLELSPTTRSTRISTDIR